MKYAADQVRKGLAGIKTYVTIGNFDFYPANSFSESDPALSYFKPFINSSQEFERFKIHGYYSEPMEFKNGTKI
jgi:hypothetical protein